MPRPSLLPLSPLVVPLELTTRSANSFINGVRSSMYHVRT